MHIRNLSVVYLLLALSFNSFAQEPSLIINEFQTSNVQTIQDEDSEFSDWIEIKNVSKDTINLAGWILTDSEDELSKWIFPAQILQPDSFLLVFASGKDKKILGSPLHANFKLSASGEYLALINPDNLPVSFLNPFPEIVTDYSYGQLDGSWVTFSKPTPGSANLITAFTKLPAPIFSHERGYYNESFQLSISSPLPQALLYFTTDGSEPTAENGFRYTGSIPISRTSVVRAKAVLVITESDTTLTSTATTKSYIFIENILNQSNTPEGYPTLWGPYSSLNKTIVVDGMTVTVKDTAIADYEMDPELTSEKAYADKIRLSLKELPVISIVTDKNHLFNRKLDSETGGIYIYTGPYGGTGDNWKRPVSFEYFNSPDSASFQVDCGIELHGGASRLPEKMPKHSFKIIFSSDYGPTKLNYRMFDDSDAKKYNAIVLRAGFGNTWAHWSSGDRNLSIYVRDMWAKRTQKRMGQLAGSGKYAHLFINGMYWGMYNPTEKIDDDFCETYLGGDKIEYDVLGGDGVVVLDGNAKAYNRMISIIDSISAVDTIGYMKLQGKNPDGSDNPEFEPLLDMENFIDYMILNYYGANGDWDSHNWICARNRYIPEKGFRFFSWDAEHVIKGVNDNRLSLNTSKSPTHIFQQLRKSPLFVSLFMDHIQKHCYQNGCLTPTGAAETFTKLIEEVENSLYAESARWGDYRKDVHKWTSAGVLYRKDVQFDALRKSMVDNYFPKRTDVFISQLRAVNLFPSINAPLFKVNNLDIVSDSIESTDAVTILNDDNTGQIFYTIDDTDPANCTNTGIKSVSGTARFYKGRLLLDKNTKIKARTLYSDVWSALTEQQFMVRELINSVSADARLLAQITASNAPNPFTNTTTFNYTLPFDAKIKLDIYDVSGRLVSTAFNQDQAAGNHTQTFDGANLPGGLYVCRFKVEGVVNHQVIFKISKL